MTWIPFSEREPTPDEKENGLWFGSSRGRRQYPWYPTRGFESYGAVRSSYTHFSPVESPTDLPPKPLPELSTGSRWSESCGRPSIKRYGGELEFGLVVTSPDYLWVRCNGTASGQIPLTDIEALKEAWK